MRCRAPESCEKKTRPVGASSSDEQSVCSGINSAARSFGAFDRRRRRLTKQPSSVTAQPSVTRA